MIRLMLLQIVLLIATCVCGGCRVAHSDSGPGPILGRQYVTDTVHISGGHYLTPYIIKAPNTEYILDGDITAEGTAIAIRASKVVLNLNGKTVIYNQKVPGEGVTIDAYNKTDIAITNGSIIQGSAMSEGDQYGEGNNPIKSIGIARLQIANISARYGGRDVGGFFVKYVRNSIVEENILEDTWSIGTLKNRHQGIDAIQITGGSNVIRNNTIINCRHRGIQVGNNDNVYGNSIKVNSLSTNSFGIFAYARQHVKIHHNTIIARGEHPIGIGAVSLGTEDIDVYNNIIDVQTTGVGEEYSGKATCFNPSTPCGNYAVGFRTNWGGNNISFHDNTITVHTDSRYKGKYSPTGESVIVDGKGRGLMVGIKAGEFARFYNNTITAIDKDGRGKAFGIACTGNNDGDMVFEGNIVNSNILNVALSDTYGYCAGHPLFIKNTFVKTDNYPAYRTVAAEFGGYWNGTGRFVSNVYQNGATQESININAAGKGRKSVYFGRALLATLEASPGVPLIQATLTLLNGSAPFDSIVLTNSDGAAELILYDYELHNRSSNTIVTRKIAPHIIQVVVGSDTLTTKPDLSASAWDTLSSKGKQIPKMYLNEHLDIGKVLTITY